MNGTDHDTAANVVKLRPPLTLALAGNPNCGKSALFNALTGIRQTTGNWPGVTVERKEGSLELDGRKDPGDRSAGDLFARCQLARRGGDARLSPRAARPI
jgi:energy-coupling factor transporter ATP-binding protein EcfA2